MITVEESNILHQIEQMYGTYRKASNKDLVKYRISGIKIDKYCARKVREAIASHKR